MCLGYIQVSKCHTQAFAWSSDSIGLARGLFGDAPFTRRSLTMSSAYRGIGTVEQASHQICHNLSSAPGCGHHSVQSTRALEKDEVCKAELVSYFHELGGKTCVFGSLKELIPDSWWTDLGFGPNAKELTPTELYARACTTRLWCPKARPALRTSAATANLVTLSCT